MKSKCALAVGMLVMGILLSGMTSAGGVSLITTDKTEYVEGEKVSIMITNNCRSPLQYSGFWVENAKGCVIFNSPVLHETIMSPGDRISETWNQIDNNGMSVKPGAYAINTDWGSVAIIVLSQEGEVSTEKAAYYEGEGVVITVANVGETTIILSGYWVEDSEGIVVYAEPTLGFVQYLMPGETRQYVWAQLDDCGEQVALGEYSVRNEWDDAVIEIVANPIAVTASQDVYAAGEDVIVTVTNTGEETIVVPNGFIVTDAAGNIVYASNVLAFMPPLQPGQSIQYVWAQTDDSGASVEAGTYTIRTANADVSITITADGDILAEVEKVVPDHRERPHPPMFMARPII